MDRWEYNLALVVAGVVVWAGIRAHRYWLSTRRPQIGSSPTDGADPMGGAKNQVTANMAPVLAPGEPPAGEDPSGPGRPRAAEVDRWVAAQPPTAGTRALIRRGTAQLGVSPNTIKRALRRLRAGGDR